MRPLGDPEGAFRVETGPWGQAEGRRQPASQAELQKRCPQAQPSPPCPSQSRSHGGQGLEWEGWSCSCSWEVNGWGAWEEGLQHLCQVQGWALMYRKSPDLIASPTQLGVPAQACNPALGVGWSGVCMREGQTFKVTSGHIGTNPNQQQNTAPHRKVTTRMKPVHQRCHHSALSLLATGSCCVAQGHRLRAV